MRRVQINAQVTAMITLLETIGTLAIMIINFVVQYNQYTLRILFAMLHFICLPYIFLVNTRENKNRLVDQGWRNLLLDSIQNISFPWAKNNNVVHFGPVKYDVNNDVCIIEKLKQQDNRYQHHNTHTLGCTQITKVPLQERVVVQQHLVLDKPVFAQQIV